MNRSTILLATVFTLVLAAGCTNTGDPLPSWNEGAAKTSIMDFVQRSTTPSSSDFVPENERIAVFDNDGTLWCEQPLYVQLLFVFDRIKTLAPDHPEWATTQPFQAVLEDDHEALHAAGEHGLIELLMATHGGVTTEELKKAVTAWMADAEHPRFARPFTELVYQPMLELLDFLRDNGFKTYIVSGGGMEFMRPMTEEVYGIPPEQVMGSSMKKAFEMREDGPVIVQQTAMGFINDKAGKPVGIQEFIGRRPVAAFGNSDGDLQMLQWTAAGAGARFMLLVRHTDEVREYAYDRDSSVGRLDQALDEAQRHGWTVVDMKQDWRVVFPHELAE